jgi:hypothetical protein
MPICANDQPFATIATSDEVFVHDCVAALAALDPTPALWPRLERASALMANTSLVFTPLEAALACTLAHARLAPMHARALTRDLMLPCERVALEVALAHVFHCAPEHVTPAVWVSFTERVRAVRGDPVVGHRPR